MPSIPETWLGQFTVNTTTNGVQNDPAVIQLANGNILVAWTSSDDTGPGSPNGTDIIGQLYDPLGNTVGSEFRLNTSGVNDAERDPELAALPSGGFLMVYEDFATDTTIRLQEYNADGSPSFSTFVVNDNTAGSPGSDNPRIAVSSNTSALVVFERFDGANTSIRGRIYDSTTNAFGAEISLIAFAGGNTDAAVAALNNGDYVITSRRGGADPSISFRIVDSAGANVLGVKTVSGTGADGHPQSQPSVTGLTNGNFVITFTNPDASDTDVRYVIYTAAGVQVTAGNAGFNPESITNNNNEPEVAALAGGGFVIVIDNDEVGRTELTHVNNAGVVQGTAIINASGVTPRIVALADGRFAVVWQDQGGTGEIQMKIMDTRDNANANDVYTPDSWQIGTIGDDTFTADGTSEFVYGYDGNDTITESGSTKGYYGGEGNDTLRVISPINSDFHDGGNGNDTIDWSGTSIDGATFDLEAGTAIKDLDTEQMVSFENLVGTLGKDEIFGTAGANILEGSDGNDVIDGRGGADIMMGGGGNDTYHVDDVGDQVSELSGEGIDKVFSSITFSLSGLQVERLELVGTGKKDGTGNQFENLIHGSNGTNVLKGARGNDTIFGKKGHDTLDGGKNNDLLDGGKGNDTLIGRKGNDILNGGQQNDLLDGGDGKDTLNGGKGGDTLIGGAERDTLIGLSGADTFTYRKISHSTVSSSGRDTIVDFSRGQGDKIDLQAMDAKSGGGNQAFDLIGNSAFTNKKGELRYFFKDGNTIIQADKDGDGTADFAIKLNDRIDLVRDDFVL